MGSVMVPHTEKIQFNEFVNIYIYLQYSEQLTKDSQVSPATKPSCSMLGCASLEEAAANLYRLYESSRDLVSTRYLLDDEATLPRERLCLVLLVAASEHDKPAYYQRKRFRDKVSQRPPDTCSNLATVKKKRNHAMQRKPV